MECDDLTHDLLLDPPSAEVRGHLDRCGACRERRAELQSIREGLASMAPARSAFERPALVRQVLARIPRETAWGRGAWPWVAAAAAAAAVLASVRLSAPPPDPAAPREAVAVSPAPVPPTRPAPDPGPPPTVRRTAQVLPEPPGVAPDRPAPSPAPAPAPAARAAEPVPSPAPAPPPVLPPPETRTAPVELTLSDVEGPLDLSGTEGWKKVSRAAPWPLAAALRSEERPARCTLPDGVRITLRPHAELRMISPNPPALALERGEAFFEVPPGAGRRFSVDTVDAHVAVTGTQFSVKRIDHTEVYVLSGEVRVANDQGEVLLPAGNATSARKGGSPGRPRPMDTDRALAWHRELDGPETALFRYDFEDGRLPPVWATGRVVKFGPPRGLNVFCLLGSPGVDANLVHLDKRVTTLRRGLWLRFRYWTAGAEMIWVQLSCVRTGDNFRFDLRNIVPRRWESVEIPLASFYRLADGSHPEEGDRFTWLNFSVAGAAEGLYFDDIELVERLK